MGEAQLVCSTSERLKSEAFGFWKDGFLSKGRSRGHEWTDCEIHINIIKKLVKRIGREWTAFQR